MNFKLVETVNADATRRHWGISGNDLFRNPDVHLTTLCGAMAMTLPAYDKRRPVKKARNYSILPMCAKCKGAAKEVEREQSKAG